MLLPLYLILLLHVCLHVVVLIQPLFLLLLNVAAIDITLHVVKAVVIRPPPLTVVAILLTSAVVVSSSPKQ